MHNIYNLNISYFFAKSQYFFRIFCNNYMNDHESNMSQQHRFSCRTADHGGQQSKFEVRNEREALPKLRQNVYYMQKNQPKVGLKTSFSADFITS